MDKDIVLDPSLEKELKGHRNSVTALFFNPNEQQIASSSLDNSVLLWDIDFRGNMRSYRFQGHDEAAMDVTFSPTGKYMASASRDKTVRIWVPTVTGSTGVFKAHSQTVRSVQFSPDGTKLITASDDKIVKLWSSSKYKFIASFVGHTNWVRCARMSNDGSVIASCSDDKTTRLWNPDSGELIHTYKDQKGHGMYLAWHPSGCYVAIGTSHGNIKLYDVRTHNLVQYYSIHNEAVTQVAFHPSGSYILTASKDGKMKILDLLEGHPIFTLSGHKGSVNAVAFSPSGESFASGGDDKSIFIWKTNFTELSTSSSIKENVVQNSKGQSSQSVKRPVTARKNQGAKAWYLCYHSTKYPVTTFVHLDDVSDTQHSERNTGRQSFSDEPRANSTMIDTSEDVNISVLRNEHIPLLHSNRRSSFSPRQVPPEYSSYSVGHTSHIPRVPPHPTTYSIPSIINESIGIETNPTYTKPSTINQSVGGDILEEENLFGMIKLKENDVCYTSGTIEWVGRKRTFPINCGFKVINEKAGINESCREDNEPSEKKAKRIDRTFPCNVNKGKECDCADVLPTVSAIVDHLNALHEAVDLVDLRLNTLEDVVSKH